jgi:hypothetical protein
VDSRTLWPVGLAVPEVAEHRRAHECLVPLQA